MQTNVVQRWRDRRDSYRPIGEVIDPRRYEVAPILTDTPARAFVEQHHYAHSLPAARFRYGLYEGPELVGVAVLSVPMRNEVLAPLPCPLDAAVELGRFVLLDKVPANSESWMLARVFELARREGVEGIVSFADPFPRADATGRVVFAGHIGSIYQASSAVYAGRGTRRSLKLLPDGSVLSARAISKVRARERGWRYVAELLQRHGAASLAETDNAVAWLATWLPRLTHTVRHPGNHRYLFGLTKGVKKRLPASLPYPKFSRLPEAA